MLNLSKYLGRGTMGLLMSFEAFAWSGPLCYVDADLDIVLTVATLAGEQPGEAKVTFEDDEGELVVVSVEPSLDFLDTHQITLRHKQGKNGIAGVVVSDLAGKDKVRYEFEFRKGLQCKGAIIETKYTSGIALVEAVDKFNETSTKKITESLVRQSVREQYKRVPVELRDEAWLVLKGRFPASADLRDISGFIRLSLMHGSVGYSFRIGQP